ncbi:nuclear transport factor 2 family protein [Confluentibacter citreus]|uniref:nuclear transport factor 2 family protein n=1 Tax=Confluentibacter citreus TaxID=2007307 RepID=UPI000C284D9E|nr:nuclear transport factor 2 family protein [Confluentibacter citreus]
MTKKEIATSFLKLAGSGKVQEAYDQFVAIDFIHHNQYFKGDRASLKAAMEDAHETEPNTFIDIKNCYQDGDTVITHSHVGKEAMDITVVHIFRFENDKIVELWDLGQVIDKDSPNENGAF